MAAGWKNPVNRVLNLSLYLLLCFLVGTGLLMWLRLPPGSGGAAGRGGRHAAADTVMGLSRHGWGEWHFWAGVALVALSVVHLGLNWTWMRKIAASKRMWRLYAGLGAGAAVIAVLALWPVR